MSDITMKLFQFLLAKRALKYCLTSAIKQTAGELLDFRFDWLTRALYELTLTDLNVPGEIRQVYPWRVVMATNLYRASPR